MQASTPQPNYGPIFIVGYIHTGTSLLKSMLRRDPTLFVAAGETHFYQGLNRNRRRFADLNDPQVLRDFVYHIVALAYLGTKRANERADVYSLAMFNLTEAQFETLLVNVGQAAAAVPAADRHIVLFGLVMDELTRLNDRALVGEVAGARLLPARHPPRQPRRPRRRTGARPAGGSVLAKAPPHRRMA